MDADDDFVDYGGSVVVFVDVDVVDIVFVVTDS